MVEKSSVSGVVRAVVSPFVIRYRSGRCSPCGNPGFEGIFFGAALELRTLLQRTHSLLEMEYFPKGDPDVQKSDAGNRSPDPSRSNDRLQRVHAGLARSVQEKIVVAPVAQAKRALRDPRQEGEHQANLQAEDNIKNDAQLCRHGCKQ